MTLLEALKQQGFQERKLEVTLETLQQVLEKENTKKHCPANINHLGKTLSI